MIRLLYTGYYDYEDEVVKVGRSTTGAVSVQGRLANTKDRTIQSAVVYFVPYNAMNDPVSCTITNIRECELRIAGPIRPGESQLFIGKDLWYNHTIESAKATRIDITYTDGSTETVRENEFKTQTLKQANAENGSKGCLPILLLNLILWPLVIWLITKM